MNLSVKFLSVNFGKQLIDRSWKILSVGWDNTGAREEICRNLVEREILEREESARNIKLRFIPAELSHFNARGFS